MVSEAIYGLYKKLPSNNLVKLITRARLLYLSSKFKLTDWSIDHKKEETGRKNYGKTTMRRGWSI